MGKSKRFICVLFATQRYSHFIVSVLLGRPCRVCLTGWKSDLLLEGSSYASIILLDCFSTVKSKSFTMDFPSENSRYLKEIKAAETSWSVRCLRQLWGPADVTGLIGPGVQRAGWKETQSAFLAMFMMMTHKMCCREDAGLQLLLLRMAQPVTVISRLLSESEIHAAPASFEKKKKEKYT